MTAVAPAIGGRLSVNAAAHRYGLDGVKMHPAIRDGRIRHASAEQKGRRVFYVLDEQELIEDLARLPRCVAAGCEAPTLRVDGYCEAHAVGRQTVNDLACKYGYDAKAAKRALQRGHVRCADPSLARILLVESEFLEDIENLPRCAFAGCGQRVLLGSRYCGSHYNLPGRERVESIRREQRRRDLNSYTSVEAAEAVGLSHAYICRAAARGEFPSQKGWHGHLRIPVAALHEWYRRTQQDRPRRHHPSRAEVAKNTRRAVEFWNEGLVETEIAAVLGCARNTACAYLERGGIDRPKHNRGRKLSTEERASAAELVERLAEHLSLTEIADELGVSRTFVRLCLDNRRRAAGEDTEPEDEGGGHLCAHCGDAFNPRVYAPRDPSFASQRYCSIQCASEQAAEGYKQALVERGLLGPLEAAARLELSPARAQQLAASGELTREWVSYEHQRRPGWGVTEEAIAQLERKWAREENTLRTRWLEPDQAVVMLKSSGRLDAKARQLGLPVSAVEAIVRDQVGRRRSRLGRRRRGPKPRTAPLPHHHRWQESFTAIRAELGAAHEANRAEAEGLANSQRIGLSDACQELGFAKRDIDQPSDYYAAQVLAERDWQEHPELREAYPAAKGDTGAIDPAYLRPAANAILMAIKRLQIAYTENSAA